MGVVVRHVVTNATSWSLVQGVLPTVKMIMKLKRQRPGPKGAVEPVNKKVVTNVTEELRFLRYKVTSWRDSNTKEKERWLEPL
jgi:hypothetical protein